MPTAQRVSGGVAGVGGTVAIRQFADTDQNGNRQSVIGADPDSMVGRLTSPSAAYGLGTGLAAAGVVLASEMDVFSAPGMTEGFFEIHGMTAIPAGLASAAVPAGDSGGGGGGGTESTVSTTSSDVVNQTRRRTSSSASTSGPTEMEQVGEEL